MTVGRSARRRVLTDLRLGFGILVTGILVTLSASPWESYGASRSGSGAGFGDSRYRRHPLTADLVSWIQILNPTAVPSVRRWLRYCIKPSRWLFGIAAIVSVKKPRPFEHRVWQSASERARRVCFRDSIRWCCNNVTSLALQARAK